MFLYKETKKMVLNPERMVLKFKVQGSRLRAIELRKFGNRLLTLENNIEMKRLSESWGVFYCSL
jgi:hypothetical protein